MQQPAAAGLIALSLAVFCASLLSPRLVSNSLFSDYFVALGFAALLYCIVNMSEEPGTVSHMPKVLAGFSYTLYLVHFPALLFLYAWLRSRSWTRWQPDLAHLIACIGILAGVVAYAWLISLLTERHTDTVRRMVAQWIESAVMRVAHTPHSADVAEQK